MHASHIAAQNNLSTSGIAFRMLMGDQIYFHVLDTTLPPLWLELFLDFYVFSWSLHPLQIFFPVVIWPEKTYSDSWPFVSEIHVLESCITGGPPLRVISSHMLALTSSIILWRPRPLFPYFALAVWSVLCLPRSVQITSTHTDSVSILISLSFSLMLSQYTSLPPVLSSCVFLLFPSLPPWRVFLPANRSPLSLAISLSDHIMTHTLSHSVSLSLKSICISLSLSFLSLYVSSNLSHPRSLCLSVPLGPSRSFSFGPHLSFYLSLFFTLSLHLWFLLLFRACCVCFFCNSRFLFVMFSLNLSVSHTEYRCHTTSCLSLYDCKEIGVRLDPLFLYCKYNFFVHIQSVSK